MQMKTLPPYIQLPQNGPEVVPPGEAAGAYGRLRVLLFANSVAIGGMEEHVKLLARLLDRTRFEVYAICPDWDAIRPFEQAMRDLADHVEVFTPDRRHGLLRELVEFWRMIRQLRAWEIDVMHMHSTTFSGQQLAFLAAKLAGVRQIYVTEHLAPEKRLPLFKGLVRDLFSRLADGIVCVSEKNYIARASNIFTPPARSLVVNNGVDVEDFEPIPAETVAALRAKHDLPADAQVIGSVVRFEPEKGLNYLLDAFPQIRAACPRAHLLLVGDGSLRESLEQQARELGVAEYVRFTGFQRNPRPYLGLIDAFVLPVPVGSMSIGLLEAMAMERAVVITFGGKGEAVVHGESGFCAEPRNPDSIAEYVIRILQNPELQRSLGEAARRRVEDEFSAQRVAQVLGDLYERGPRGVR